MVQPLVVRYPWSSTLYAVLPFSGGYFFDRLAPDEWWDLGQPTPLIAGWIGGSLVEKYGSSPEIYVEEQPEVGFTPEYHTLTYAEWAAMGFHQPEIWWQDLYFFKYSDSPVIYKETHIGPGPYKAHALTWADWAQAHFPTPEVRSR